jgi:cell division protein FtsN
MAQAKKTARGASRSPTRHGLPASLLLGTGFIAGVVCSLLVYTAMGKQAGIEEKAATAKTLAEAKTQADRKEVTTNTKFDFFTLLPEREVIVTDERPISKAEPKPAKDNGQAPVSTPDTSVEKYILQAGSFRQNADADRRRAQILLLGLDAKVESVVANGDRWHRVYVGPFQSHNTLSDARSKLINESIDTLVIRQKN